MKFMINQLRGSMQESEMRATAAEHRVAMLQGQIKELESCNTEIETQINEEEIAEMESQYK